MVLFKLRGTSDDEREHNRREFSALLSGLQSTVPGIVTLSINHNSGSHPSNWDIAFMTDFADFDQLELYRGHPKHLEVVDALDVYTSDRAAVDFEI